MIKLHNISKTYTVGERKTTVLKKVNLQIKTGEFISIIGPSGSGKSTLLHLISGLDLPTHGEIFIEENNLAKLSDAELSTYRNKKIGFVFQSFHLLNQLNIHENISLPFLLQKNNKSAEQQTNKLLKEVGLASFHHHRPNQLSGGQKQRVAIARALMNNPQIILADEPTGNLDSKTGEMIIKLLQKIHQERGITLIIVTHDQHIASQADRVIEIKDGEIHQTRNLKTFTH